MESQGALEAMPWPTCCHRSPFSAEAEKQQGASQDAVEVAQEQDTRVPTRLMCMARTQWT